jgi:hypothetical protein
MASCSFGSDVDLSDDRTVIRTRGVASLAWILGDGGSGSCAVGSHGTVWHVMHQGVTDENVVDQLVASSESAAEPLILRDAGCEVPQSLPVASVVLVESRGTDLRAGRTVHDLGGRCFRDVVEVSQDDDATLLALVVEQLCDFGSDRGSRVSQFG